MSIAYQPAFQPKFQLSWINESWQLFLAQSGTWVVTAIIVFVAGLVVRAGASLAFGLPLVVTHSAGFQTAPGLGGMYLSTWSLPQDALSLISIVVHSFFLCGAIRMANAQVRGEPIRVEMLFQGAPVFLNMLLYDILAAIVVGVGLVLCIVPGLIALALLWPGYALIADGRPISEALTASIDRAKVDIWGGAGFVVVFGIVLLLSCIPCGLGLLATVPMGWIVCALIYRDLVGMPGGPAQAASPYGGNQPGVWPPAPGQGSQNPPESPYGSYPASSAPTDQSTTFAPESVESPAPSDDSAESPDDPENRGLL